MKRLTLKVFVTYLFLFLSILSCLISGCSEAIRGYQRKQQNVWPAESSEACNPHIHSSIFLINFNFRIKGLVGSLKLVELVQVWLSFSNEIRNVLKYFWIEFAIIKLTYKQALVCCGDVSTKVRQITWAQSIRHQPGQVCNVSIPNGLWPL